MSLYKVIFTKLDQSKFKIPDEKKNIPKKQISKKQLPVTNIVINEFYKKTKNESDEMDFFGEKIPEKIKITVTEEIVQLVPRLKRVVDGEWQEKYSKIFDLSIIETTEDAINQYFTLISIKNKKIKNIFSNDTQQMEKELFNNILLETYILGSLLEDKMEGWSYDYTRIIIEKNNVYLPHTKLPLYCLPTELLEKYSNQYIDYINQRERNREKKIYKFTKLLPELARLMWLSSKEDVLLMLNYIPKEKISNMFFDEMCTYIENEIHKGKKIENIYQTDSKLRELNTLLKKYTDEEIEDYEDLELKSNRIEMVESQIIQRKKMLKEKFQKNYQKKVE